MPSVFALAFLVASVAVARADEGEGASFGTDLSAGMGVGSMLGAWPVPGIHTLGQVRLDAFLVDRDIPGPRFGLSLHAALPAVVLQEGLEEEGAEVWHPTIRYVQSGVMGVLRFDPATAWTGLAGLGLSRLELDDYWGGPYAVPMRDLEVGVRRGFVRSHTFMDVTARVGWGSLRDGAVLEDLWLLQGVVSFGGHAR